MNRVRDVHGLGDVVPGPADPDVPADVDRPAITAVVGFAGAFTIVLAGLDGIGASTAQASSGLMVLCLMQAMVAIWLGLRHRMPISIAWSTPGAALLATLGPVEGGYAAALGAFVVTGLLIMLAGLSRTLGRLIAAIPVPIASAMLAGVLLPLCVAPARAATELPGLTLPVIAVWLVLMRFARRWAVPGALAATAVVVLLDPGSGGSIASDLKPALTFVAPTFTTGALAGIAIPLFLVTTASQNIPGMGVLASFGYRPPLRPILTGTGAGTVVGAPFGGHAINLAAITAALAAGPEAGPDPARRWIASVTAGGVYVVLGLGAALATALFAACPPLLVEAVAGLALIGAFGGALSTALSSDEHRDAAVVTLVACASGITAAGVGAAFWGLLAGLLVLRLQRASLRPLRLRTACVSSGAARNLEASGPAESISRAKSLCEANVTGSVTTSARTSVKPASRRSPAITPGSPSANGERIICPNSSPR